MPFSVLPTAQSYLTPAGPNPTGYVAPSGFRTLSTPCSLRGLLGLFHPSSARGLCPSRSCSPRDAVRFLKRRDPHDLCPIRKQAGPSGFHTRLAELPVDLGFSQVTPTDTSMGFSPAGFLVVRGCGLCKGHLPSRASPLESQAGPKNYTTGFPATENQVFLSRDRPTPLRFPTSLPSSTLWICVGRGSFFSL